MGLFVLFMSVAVLGAVAYLPPGKETFLGDSLLREVVERMGKDLADAAAAADAADADAYLDFSDGSARLPPLGALLRGRGAKALAAEEQPFAEDYERLSDLANPHPSIRDQEYLQHSSLWGHQYMTGGAGGEGGDKTRLKPDGALGNQKDLKNDALPAYCNPPNPCPVGYGTEAGCLQHFENTAVFSRDFQAAQDCMCDSEHMFECPARTGRGAAAAAAASAAAAAAAAAGADLSASDIDRIVAQLQVEDQHKSLVAKKFHVKKDSNPFLRGEKLPVAAKKGNNVVY